MTQYDAGPGEWSDRPWEDPGRKPKPHARRPRVTLPPWALLAILVGLVIVLCVGLVLIVRAIRGEDGKKETATPAPTFTAETRATDTPLPIMPTAVVTPTDTVVLPIDTPSETPRADEITPGARVVVQGTLGLGLNLRAEPTTRAALAGQVNEGTVLVVLEGPSEADGYIWWKVRSPDGKVGWGAANWLLLQTE